MNTKLFFYKLLSALNKQGMSIINVEDLTNKKDLLIDLLNSYNYKHYAKILNNIIEFKLFILIIFLDFEMGIYDKDKDTLTFEDDPGMNRTYFDNMLIDISDDMINELAALIKLDLNNKRQLSIN